MTATGTPGAPSNLLLATVETCFLLTLRAVAKASKSVGLCLGSRTPWERWKTCDHFAAITLERIDPDGRLVVNGYASEAAPFTACVRDAAADQIRRGVAAGPQASVLVRLYGCMGGAT